MLHCYGIKLGPRVCTRIDDASPDLSHLEQVLHSALIHRDPLHSKDPSVYTRLSQALAPTLHAIVETNVGATRGFFRELVPREVVEVSEAGGIVKVCRGVYLIDIQTALVDAASSIMPGVPLNGGCFPPDLVADLIQAAVDSQQWVAPPKPDLLVDWEDLKW
jgi:hypothetical protein